MANRLITGIVTTLARLCGGAAWGAAPFVVDSVNGTVTDTRTGLMWDQCAAELSGSNCYPGAAQTDSWVNALALAATKSAANYKGYSDWRLPNIHELLSLVLTSSVPAIDSVFPRTPAYPFWSGSPNVSNSNFAWAVDFSDGGAWGNSI